MTQSYETYYPNTERDPLILFPGSSSVSGMIRRNPTLPYLLTLLSSFDT